MKKIFLPLLLSFLLGNLCFCAEETESISFSVDVWGYSTSITFRCSEKVRSSILIEYSGHDPHSSYSTRPNEYGFCTLSTNGGEFTISYTYKQPSPYSVALDPSYPDTVSADIVVYTNNSSSFSRVDIQNCSNLTELNCHTNSLSLNSVLTKLICHGVKKLDLNENTALTYLDCSNSHLTSLDLSKNTALTYLDCSHCDLTSLDLSKNTALTTLNCKDNNMEILDIRNNTALTTLNCSENRLTILNLKNNNLLTHLQCQYNEKLEILDVSVCPDLTYLDYSSTTNLVSQDLLGW